MILHSVTKNEFKGVVWLKIDVKQVEKMKSARIRVVLKRYFFSLKKKNLYLNNLFL